VGVVFGAVSLVLLEAGISLYRNCPYKTFLGHVSTFVYLANPSYPWLRFSGRAVVVE
jgi:hypothetical protein